MSSVSFKELREMRRLCREYGISPKDLVRLQEREALADLEARTAQAARILSSRSEHAAAIAEPHIRAAEETDFSLPGREISDLEMALRFLQKQVAALKEEEERLKDLRSESRQTVNALKEHLAELQAKLAHPPEPRYKGDACRFGERASNQVAKQGTK